MRTINAKLIRMALVFAVVAGACSKKSNDIAGSTSMAGSASDESPPAYTGTLTIPMVLAAGKAVRPFDDWNEAMPKLEKIAGKPTETHDAYSCWSAIEGESSACFCIEKTTFEELKRPGKHGPAVGSKDNPHRLDASSPEGNRAECKKLAGK